MEQWYRVLKTVLAFQLTIALAIGAVGCSDRVVASEGNRSQLPPKADPEIVISEVSPPEILQELSQVLDFYHPQVTIVSPQPDEIIEDDTVTLQLQVQNLPIFKNEKFGLGPHLQVILDNQPYTTIYDLSQPLVLSDLSPGTHTLRVFAARPWFESFKNEGAYAQTTFHLYTPSDDNTPQSTLPLLTYNQPQGNYGAEPILLDFYLTNAPLHLIAQESAEDDIVDWRIRCTIDGKSFMIDRWQPLYLTGFRPGKNWVKLEFLDELGNPVKNAFNQTIRIVTYQPGTEDPLSKLIAGEFSLEEVRGIVDPHYIYEEETPQLAPILEPTPEAIENPGDVTIPEILEEPMTSPEPLEDPLEEPATLPEILEDWTEEPEENLEQPQFTEELSVPTAEPESLEHPELTLEDSEEDFFLEEENRSNPTYGDEMEVPPQEHSPSEIVPQATPDRLPEPELAPLESQEEVPVVIPEPPGLDEILPDSQAPDLVEPSELQIQLDPTTLEKIPESDPSLSPTLKAIEPPDLASPTDPTVTPLPQEVETAQSQS